MKKVLRGAAGPALFAACLLTIVASATAWLTLSREESAWQDLAAGLSLRIPHLTHQTADGGFEWVADADGVTVRRNCWTTSGSTAAWSWSFSKMPTLQPFSATAVAAQTNSFSRAGVLLRAGRWNEFDPAHSRRYYVLRVPHWLIITLAAGFPLRLALRRSLRRRAFAAGLCPACGYDLRATPARCPECGTRARSTPILEGPATPARPTR